MLSRDLRMAEDTRGASIAVILLISALLLAFLTWAALAEIDEVTRGDGRIIPSQKTQIIQSAEPGVVTEIFVRVGQRIAKNDLLFRLDKTPTAANLGELEAKTRTLTAQIVRLELEQEGKLDVAYPCPEVAKRAAQAVCLNEERLFRAKAANLKGRVKVFEQRVEQKQRELNEVGTNMQRLKESLDLAQQELALIRPLAERQIIAETELLRVQRTVADLRGQLETATETKARAEAGLREATLQVNEQMLAFKQLAQAELNDKRAELSVVDETIRGAAERVRRTDIHSPVDGIVNEVLVTTQGAFINAGDRVVSIVPVDDKLLVEARVRPSDIAFIHPGQAAVVKVTAFDFSIFGGLDGIVENVGADTSIDPVSKEPYYTVIIRTNDSTLRGAKGNHDIIPGMVCNVDIMTGKKTIMQYLLKPINKAREQAFRER